MCLAEIPISEYKKNKCYHRNHYCKFLEELADGDFWCYKYESFIDEIEYGECIYSKTLLQRLLIRIRRI